MTNLEKEELLAEARKRFPINSQVSNYNLGKNCTFLMKSHDFQLTGNKELLVYCGYGSGYYTIYSEEQWAEIISFPKDYIPEINHNLTLVL